jgi:hypothetical protein
MWWVKSGSVDRKIPFNMGDIGLSSFTVYRSRNGGTPAAMTSPTIDELDDTNMPGEYAVTFDEDTTMDAGSITEPMVLMVSHAGVAPVRIEVTLFNNLPSDIVLVNGAATGVILGEAETGTLSTTQITSDLTGFTADQLEGRRLVVIGGPAEGESRAIDAYVESGGLITFAEAMTVAMEDGDPFKIV